MRSISIIAVTIVAICMAACSDDDSTPNTPSTTEVLMPLAVGNTWTFHSVWSVGGGEDRDSTYTLTVDHSKVDSLGRVCYTVFENEDEYTVWWVNTAEGYEMFGQVMGRMLFRFPAQAGDKYTHSTNLADYNITVSKIDTLVQTQAGAFRCYQYDYADATGAVYARDFYSPGVGCVYRYISGAMDTEMTQELIAVEVQ